MHHLLRSSIICWAVASFVEQAHHSLSRRIIFHNEKNDAPAQGMMRLLKNRFTCSKTDAPAQKLTRLLNKWCAPGWMWSKGGKFTLRGERGEFFSKKIGWKITWKIQWVKPHLDWRKICRDTAIRNLKNTYFFTLSSSQGEVLGVDFSPLGYHYN